MRLLPNITAISTKMIKIKRLEVSGQHTNNNKRVRPKLRRDQRPSASRNNKGEKMRLYKLGTRLKVGCSKVPRVLSFLIPI